MAQVLRLTHDWLRGRELDGVQVRHNNGLREKELQTNSVEQITRKINNREITQYDIYRGLHIFVTSIIRSPELSSADKSALIAYMLDTARKIDIGVKHPTMSIYYDLMSNYKVYQEFLAYSTNGLMNEKDIAGITELAYLAVNDSNRTNNGNSNAEKEILNDELQ